MGKESELPGILAATWCTSKLDRLAFLVLFVVLKGGLQTSVFTYFP